MHRSYQEASRSRLLLPDNKKDTSDPQKKDTSDPKKKTQVTPLPDTVMMVASNEHNANT